MLRVKKNPFNTVTLFTRPLVPKAPSECQTKRPQLQLFQTIVVGLHLAIMLVAGIEAPQTTTVLLKTHKSTALATTFRPRTNQNTLKLNLRELSAVAALVSNLFFYF